MLPKRLRHWARLVLCRPRVTVIWQARVPIGDVLRLVAVLKEPPVRVWTSYTNGAGRGRESARCLVYFRQDESDTGRTYEDRAHCNCSHSAGEWPPRVG